MNFNFSYTKSQYGLCGIKFSLIHIELQYLLLTWQSVEAFSSLHIYTFVGYSCTVLPILYQQQTLNDQRLFVGFIICIL
jgi:hypothetical protein